jgi:3-dehydroquinate dehydratase II
MNALRILIVNGPNLNKLGEREPEIYGDISFESMLNELKNSFQQHELEYFQSNHEGELIDKIQTLNNNYDACIINAGGYAHTSVALADAVKMSNKPVIGIHISNVYQREPERHTDLLTKYCTGQITGLGMQGYVLAVMWLIEKLKK